MEGAAAQSYEGRHFSGSVVFTKRLPPFENKAGAAMIRFNEPFAFGNAMLTEKWVRPLLALGDLALIGVGHTGIVVGMLAFEVAASKPMFLAPHEKLSGFYEYVRPGTMAMTVTEHGDILSACQLAKHSQSRTADGITVTPVAQSVSSRAIFQRTSRRAHSDLPWTQASITPEHSSSSTTGGRTSQTSSLTIGPLLKSMGLSEEQFADCH
jgi:hypothetical protein